MVGLVVAAAAFFLELWKGVEVASEDSKWK